MKTNLASIAVILSMGPEIPYATLDMLKTGEIIKEGKNKGFKRNRRKQKSNKRRKK